MKKRNPYLVNKAFNGFLLASILTAAANQVSAAVDGVMLSHLIGEEAMSSVNICRPVLQVLFSLCMLFGAGSSMLVGIAIGYRNRQEANRVFTAVISLVMVVGFCLLLLGLVWLDPLVNFLCPDVGLRGVTSDYLGVMLYGAVFYMLSAVLEMFVTVDGSPKQVTLAVVVSSFSNLLLDYVFIAIMGWGVMGAAWATVISYIVAVVLLLPHFMRPVALRISFSRCLPTLSQSLSTGLPFGLATMMIAVQMWGNNRIAMTYLGQGGFIALSVCVYLLCLSMIILTGTLKAFQPVASILKGAGDGNGVLLVVRKAYSFMGLCLLVFVLPLVLCPQWVAWFFGVTDASFLQITTSAIPPYSLNIILQCVVYLLITIYQLYNNKAMANFVSIGQSLAPMFGMWLLAEVAPAYVWWGFALGQVVIVLFILLFSFLTRLRNKELMPVILMPQVDNANGFNTSIPARIEVLGELLTDLEDFLRVKKVDAQLMMHIEVCSEELLKNAIEHGATKKGKKRFLDYRLLMDEHHITVVFTDDGVPFDPVQYDKQTGLGLLLVRGMCHDIKYDYLFHQNVVSVSFPID